jgi:hypothetical protein
VATRSNAGPARPRSSPAPSPATIPQPFPLNLVLHVHDHDGGGLELTCGLRPAVSECLREHLAETVRDAAQKDAGRFVLPPPGRSATTPSKRSAPPHAATPRPAHLPWHAWGHHRPSQVAERPLEEGAGRSRRRVPTTERDARHLRHPPHRRRHPARVDQQSRWGTPARRSPSATTSGGWNGARRRSWPASTRNVPVFDQSPRTGRSRKGPQTRLDTQSGRPDSNRRPLVPQTSALTRLRHAPRLLQH